MKRYQTALVLAKIATIDNRKLDPIDADIDDPMSTPILDAWHEVIGDLGFEDCIGAVLAHRRSSTEYLNPAHVVAGVSAIRAARMAKCPPLGQLMADIDGADPAWDRILKARRQAIADGRPGLKSVTA